MNVRRFKMNVRELNKDQLNELKLKIYYMSFDELENEFSETLNDLIILDLEKVNYYQDIKDDIIYQLFDHFSFINEDFLCSNY